MPRYVHAIDTSPVCIGDLATTVTVDNYTATPARACNHTTHWNDYYLCQIHVSFYRAVYCDSAYDRTTGCRAYFENGRELLLRRSNDCINV